MYIARKSSHIKDDIKRNWSSWNSGEDGFSGTRAEFDALLDTITDSNPVMISGFEIYSCDKAAFTFGELYPNYFVAIDKVNAKDGLSCVELASTNIVDAIKEATTRTDYFGDGQSFDAKTAVLVCSKGDIHIFEV